MVEGKKKERDNEGVCKKIGFMLLKGIFEILFLISITRGIVVANQRVSSLICFWSFLHN